MSGVVHMVGRVNGAELEIDGPDVRTLCGKEGSPMDGVPSRYTLATAGGSLLEATTRRRFVSCAKCNRTLGGSK